MLARIRISLVHAVLAAIVLISTVAVAAQSAAEYPSRPIGLVVPFAAGGITDIIARVVGQKLNDQWGKPVIVDNRGGANGVIAMEIVARAVPDGHTLVL